MLSLPFRKIRRPSRAAGNLHLLRNRVMPSYFSASAVLSPDIFTDHIYKSNLTIIAFYKGLVNCAFCRGEVNLFVYFDGYCQRGYFFFVQNIYSICPAYTITL